MSDNSEQLAVPLAKTALRMHRVDSVSARKNQWRLELERAYQVEHTESEVKHLSGSATTPAAAEHQPGVPLSGTTVVSATVSASANVSMQRLSRSVSVGGAGSRGHAPQSAFRPDWQNPGGPLLGGTTAKAADTARTGVRLESLPPVLLAPYARKQADPGAVRVTWNNGTAYVYVPAGIIDEAVIEDAVRHIRNGLERAGIRVAGIMIAGVERWVEKRELQKSPAACVEHTDQILNRIY